MLDFFYRHKGKYSKGQMAPIFILILVILIIMAMVTVNLNKAAFIKTESSNSADAGALAAGSAMASNFNAIAQANSQLETYYWEFYAVVSVSYSMALYFLIRAHTTAISAYGLGQQGMLTAAGAMAKAVEASSLACPDPCAAIKPAGEAAAEAAAASQQMSLALAQLAIASPNTVWLIRTSWAILISITGFSVAQLFFYGVIRNMAQKGRDNAVILGHKFSFMNSGTGAKLKEGEPPQTQESEDEPQDLDKRNYRETFSDFLSEEIDEKKRINYDWRDGDRRKHDVISNIAIDPVDTFDLRVAALPLPAELLLVRNMITSGEASMALLTKASEAYMAAQMSYMISGISYMTAAAFLAVSCACYGCIGAPIIGPKCAACHKAFCAKAQVKLDAGIKENTLGMESNAEALAENFAAITKMASIYAPLSISWAGLLPGFILRSHDLIDASPFIICWIDDLVHNRLVRADIWQEHQGEDLGLLWEMRYPQTHSYSIVDFEGRGKIYKPVLRHDSSIVETDNQSGQAYDTCPTVKQEIGRLEAQALELEGMVAPLTAQAEDLEADAAVLESAGQVEDANALRKAAGLLRDNVNWCVTQAENNREKAGQIREANTNCFLDLS